MFSFKNVSYDLRTPVGKKNSVDGKNLQYNRENDSEELDVE